MWQFSLSDDGGTTWHRLINPDKSDYEPSGWDEVQFSLKRGPEGNEPWIDGADFTFSSTMTFEGMGARIIKLAYDNFGIDADVRIQIDRVGCNYSFSGFVDFTDYNEQPFCGQDCGREEVTVRLFKSGFAQTMKNRIDVAVDLSKTVGTDGQELSDIQGFEVKLHSKEILYTSDWKINEFLNDYTIVELPDAASHTPPLESITTELDFSLQPSSYSFQNPLLYSGFSYPPGVTTRRIYIKGRLKATSQATGEYSTLAVWVYISQPDENSSEISHEQMTIQPYTGGSTSLDYTFPDGYYVDLLPNQNLGILLIHPPSDASGLSISFQWDREASYVEFFESSVITPSSAYSYRIMDALTKITESITGVPDGVYSDFLSDECHQYMVLTNGLNIRKMRDKNGNLFPVSVSFKDLYDALDAIYCLGMRIEKVGESERIRIEHRSFFYSQEVAQTFDFVPDVNMQVDLTHYYNEAEFGYSKWQTEDVNGLDEFNSRRVYDLPVKNAKKKLSRISNIIASGYLIEQTRRQQFKEKPTSDYGTDNDLFFICTNRTEQTSSLYDIDIAGNPVENLYAPGTISERNENYTTIANLLSPETAYNLRISPARMARHHYPLLAVSLYKKNNAPVKFRSGVGNYQMESQSIDECSPETGNLGEYEDINFVNIRDIYQQALFIPETLEFTVGGPGDEPRFTFDHFLQAVANTIGRYEASCGEIEHFGGTIKTLNYRPNKEGGFGEFVLQRG